MNATCNRERAVFIAGRLVWALDLIDQVRPTGGAMNKPDPQGEDAHKGKRPDDAATEPENVPAGHPRREGNELTGTHQAQPPSGLRPDLDEAGEAGRGGDGGGVDKSL